MAKDSQPPPGAPPKPQKPRVPVSPIMQTAAKIDRILNSIPEGERQRVLAVVIASQGFMQPVAIPATT